VTGLPNFKVPALLKRKARIQETLNGLSRISEIGLGEVDELVDMLICDLQGKYLDRSSARLSLRSILIPFIGSVYDMDNRARIASLVAGLNKAILAGIPYKQWSPLSKASWASVYVSDAVRMCSRNVRYRICLESLEGLSSGEIWYKVFPASFIQHVLRTVGGNRYSKYLCDDIGGLWFTAAVSGGTSSGVKLDQIHASSSQVRINRDILKGRKDKCIGGFTEGTCMLCPVGMNRCRLSRHKDTYVKDICRNTGKGRHAGYIARNGYCLSCMSHGCFKPEE
jgi:hypothetical protein